MERLRALVVDDDSALAGLIGKYLERLDFEVERISDSNAALDRFRTSNRPYDLVFADMTMPHLSGEELLRAILSTDAHVRAILSSGYVMSGSALEQEFAGRIEFLQKPFFPKMLADTVSKLFGRVAGSQTASSSAS